MRVLLFDDVKWRMETCAEDVIDPPYLLHFPSPNFFMPRLPCFCGKTFFNIIHNKDMKSFIRKSSHVFNISFGNRVGMATINE
mmetsp:Transcript_35024/g.57682  ORF Transcript_35024/g.57682 Transcript_35024/m.57682 type:complete len:83 (+) Transcript_35024:220-468(+)